jgi:phosphoribosylformylglycinamidine synthase
MASPAEMIGNNMLRLQSFPSNVVWTQLNYHLITFLFPIYNRYLVCSPQGKQRHGFVSARAPSLRKSRMVRHCLNLRHLCWLPNQRVTVPNIRPVPAQSAAVSRGVSSQLIEDSVDDLELVPRIIHFYRTPFLQESETKELLRKV